MLASHPCHEAAVDPDLSMLVNFCAGCHVSRVELAGGAQSPDPNSSKWRTNFPRPEYNLVERESREQYQSLTRITRKIAARGVTSLVAVNGLCLGGRSIRSKNSNRFERLERLERFEPDSAG